MRIEARVFPDAESLSQAAAAEVATLAKAAVARRGRFTLALSGGRTPERLYRLLAGPLREEVPWGQVHLYWGDERYLPATDPRSNQRMVRETLLAHVPVPPAQVHPMPTHPTDPDEAARLYEQELRESLGEEAPVMDLLLLGMGADGHTASLFPGTPAAEEQERWVMAVRAAVEPPLRLSVTRPVLSRARRTLFLVTGADKHPVWTEISADPEKAGARYPAALVGSAANAVWFLDRDAAGNEPAQARPT